MSYRQEVTRKLPIVGSLHLGHTPFQINYFKTSQQRGSRKFEYWQHLIQIKSLASAVDDLALDVEETTAEIEELNSWRNVFSFRSTRKKRDIQIRRLAKKREELVKSLMDKKLECNRHLELLSTEYKDLEGITEAEILKEEESYWVSRLSRQIAFTRFASQHGLGPGELQAVAALPPSTMQKILCEAQQLLTTGTLWTEEAPKQLEE